MKLLPNSLPIVLLLIISLTGLAAQNAVPGQWLVRLDRGVSPVELLERLNRQANNPRRETPADGQVTGLGLEYKVISPSLNIWLLTQKVDNPALLTWLLQQTDVKAAQPNHYVALRSNALPNDPLFSQQWQYLNDGSNGGAPNADLDADLAWTITTGGLSPAGDTIVVAVIDGGVNKSHPDLVQNMWFNQSEIPNDGLDNDNNGYVDDYRGWNVFAQNDNIQGITALHGTPVSGIIGASGDNAIGVTGVNWKVKIMFVVGGNLESDLLAAYEYVLQSRRRYNESNGAAGAFVVAANCSWGIDYGMPADAPIWCSAFDELGEAGVLSVAATANNAVNVDDAGDLPTTCPSDYLISVTSLDRADQKAASAAWGPLNIDLGAYGENIVSTSMGNQYGTHAGTSFAAPQVAGAIGLLYAASCPELIAKAESDPKAAALWAKSLILNSVTPNASLDGKTLTNGRLNLFNLLEQYQDHCASCPAPFALKLISSTPYTALLGWINASTALTTHLRWRIAGATEWLVVENAEMPFQLEGLSPCTPYEFCVQNPCADDVTSEWSAPFSFYSMGCCEVPNFTWTATLQEQSVQLHLGLLHNYYLYKLRIREIGTDTWQTFLTQDSLVSVFNLHPCTHYEMIIQGWCFNAWVDLTPLTQMVTLGCGACLEKPYCPSGGMEAEEEWIKSVQVGSWLFDSGSGGGGYQNLTGMQDSNPEIGPQSTVNVVLTPDFWGTPYKEYFRVYIDFNLDGDFDDPGELAFDPGFAQEGVVSGSLTSPDFSQTGSTRMRVMMKYATGNEVAPQACEVYDFGQTEDYCIDLTSTPTDAKITLDSTLLLKIYPQPASHWVWLDVAHSDATQLLVKVWDISGRQLLDKVMSPLRNKAVYLDTNNWPSGIYFVSAESEGRVFRGKIVKR